MTSFFVHIHLNNDRPGDAAITVHNDATKMMVIEMDVGKEGQMGYVRRGDNCTRRLFSF
jgi:hypothetical protein